MSYCRFSSGDVYMYAHVDGGICCCSCHMAPKVKSIWTKGGKTDWHKSIKATQPCKWCKGKGCDQCMMSGDTMLRTKRQALRPGVAVGLRANFADWRCYLLLHRSKGDQVPDYAIERLRQETKEAHRRYLKRKNRK